MARVVCIGGSTGAPVALGQLLSGLPKEFPLPILVGIHLPPAVSRAFVLSIEGRTPLGIHLAEGDLAPLPGQVYFGIGGKHIGVGRSGRIVVTPNPQETFFKPSLDVLFYTAAQALGPDVLAVVLNGLSSQLDGVQGAKAVKTAQGQVIAIDDPANPHLGLPKNVISAGAATHVCRLPELADTLIRMSALPGSNYS